MSKAIITEALLSAIANAIRAKTGGSSSMTPAEMATAISNIPTGGGGSSTLGTKTITENGTYAASGDNLDGYSSVTVNVSASGGGDFVALVERTLTTVSDATITKIGGNAFREYTGLTALSLPNATSIGTGGLYGCTGLQSVNLHGVNSIAGNALYNVTLSLAFPAITSVAMNGFNTYKGAAVDFGPGLSTLNQYVFKSASALNTLILRNPSIVTLSNKNTFDGTKFASGGAGGTIYIPKALYDKLGTGTDDYQATGAWATLHGYGTITWAAIEGSQYESAYVDGTAISS